MGRLSGRFRKFRGISWPTAMTTNTVGTVSFLGPRMHRTPSGKPPRFNSHRCTAYSATNPLCSPGWKNLLTFQLWTTSYGRARESGTHIYLQQAVRRDKTFADARRSHFYRPGDKVWLSCTGICIPAISWVPTIYIYRYLHHREGDKWGHLPPPAPSTVSYIVFTLHSTFQSSSPSLPLSQAQRNQ